MCSTLPPELSRTQAAAGPSRSITRRRFLQAAGLATAGMALYSGEIARHHLEIVHRPMLLRNLPEPFHGFRIVQISDIHLEEYTEPFFLRRAIREVNFLAPDLILLTGDFITHGPPRSRPEAAIYQCADMLRALTCPQRIACLGNHDSIVGITFISRVLEEYGTPVLSNQYVPVERGGSRLWIGGVEDPATSRPQLDLAVPDHPDGPVLLMAHAPDYIDWVLQAPKAPLVDYILSGHTHGGQVRLPIVGPLILPPMGKKYVQGHFQVGNLQLYVNRGLGSVGLPFRFDCPPEITHFTLQPMP